MNFDSGTVADKLKQIRLGKSNQISFKYEGVEYLGRPLDWVEEMIVDSEVKSALHVDTINYRNTDQLIYRMLAELNKGVIITSKEDAIAPEWLVKSQEPETGMAFLRGFYSEWEKAIYPNIDRDKKPPPSKESEKETKQSGKK